MSEVYADSMIDIETLDTGPNAVVLSVGAVLFNLHETDTHELLEADEKRNFFSVLEFESQIELGRTISASTILWWMAQNKQAQRETFKEQGREDTYNALRELRKFIGGTRPWGNGSSFDNTIMDTLFTAYGVSPPPFYLHRDLRTLKQLSMIDPSANRGVEHSAIEDARYQVLCAQEYYREINGIRET